MKKSVRLLLKATLAAIIVMLFFTIGCQQQVVETITEEQVKTLGERVLAIWNEGNLQLVDEIFSSDCIRHDCGLPEDVKGLDGMKQYFESMRSAFPDINISVDDIIYQDDKIVWWWTLAGTNSGALQGLPPTNNEMQLTGVSIAKVADGKMIEVWDYYNQASMFQQLGFSVSPPQTTELK